MPEYEPTDGDDLSERNDRADRCVRYPKCLVVGHRTGVCRAVT